jgi:hypothetical protein
VKQVASSISLILKHGFVLVFLLPLPVLEELVFYHCSLQVEDFNEDVSYIETFSFTSTRCFVGTSKVVTSFPVSLQKRIRNLQMCVKTDEGISK